MSALPIVEERISQMLRAVSNDPNPATVDDVLSGEVFDMVAAYTRYGLTRLRLHKDKFGGRRTELKSLN